MTAPAIAPSPFQYPKQDPLRQSVTSLALVAMQAAGADGCHIAEAERLSGSLVNRYSNGAALPAWLESSAAGVIHGPGVVVAAYHLQAQGLLAGRLAFVFRSAEVAREKLAILEKLAPIIESVHALPYLTARIASRIARLEAELAAMKIVERTRGILAGGATESGAVETVVGHVESVLEGHYFGSSLRQLLPDIEDRIAQRRVVVEAKAMLENLCGMSEEEAYLYLRVRSRSTRRRISDVAQEVLSGENSWDSKVEAHEV
jgi:ANTAR domain